MSIMWFVILLVFGLPIGLICAILYVFVSPFSVCCGGCNDVIEFLRKGLDLPRKCATNMASQ